MWPDDETPEPAAWINFNAATGERNVSFVCESELASIPLWPEPPRSPRRPLTDEEIEQLFGAIADTPRAHWLRQAAIEVVRKTEAAHGIKEQEHE